jgi:hypothetical protein
MKARPGSVREYSILIASIVIATVLLFAAISLKNTVQPDANGESAVQTSKTNEDSTTTIPVVIATSTPAETASSSPSVIISAPKILSISPASGPANTTVTINGTSFVSGSNLVLFGNSANRHRPDGTPGNSYPADLSADGKTLTFLVPNSGPSGILCDSSNHCVGISAILLTPGSYTIMVMNKNGTSNAVVFQLTK